MAKDWVHPVDVLACVDGLWAAMTVQDQVQGLHEAKQGLFNVSCSVVVTQCDPNQCFSLIRAFSSRLVGTCSTASGIIRCNVPLASLSLDLTSWPGMESYENEARHECCCSV